MILFKIFFEFWRKIRCPKCQKINWLYDSHSQRYYPYICDGLKCHACGNVFWIGEKEEFEARYECEMEENSFEYFIDNYFTYIKGREYPE